MKVTVKLFAIFREAAGAAEAPLEVREGTSASDVWEELTEKYPRLRPYTRSVAFAINGRHVRPGAPLSEGDVVAFLPPVSGG